MSGLAPEAAVPMQKLPSSAYAENPTCLLTRPLSDCSAQSAHLAGSSHAACHPHAHICQDGQPKQMKMLMRRLTWLMQHSDGHGLRVRVHHARGWNCCPAASCSCCSRLGDNYRSLFAEPGDNTKASTRNLGERYGVAHRHHYPSYI